MKRIFIVLMLLLFIPIFIVSAEENEDLRVEYQNFLSSYSENIIFLNTNTGRNLIPLVFSSGETENDLRVYRLYGDILSATVKTKGTSRGIVWCQIILSAPSEMTYGDNTYRDFVTSGLHSYALLMSMHRSDDTQVRYVVVTEVNEGLSKANEYETTVGDYKLRCVRSGNTVTLTYGWHEWEPQSQLTQDDSVYAEETIEIEDEESIPDSDNAEG